MKVKVKKIILEIFKILLALVIVFPIFVAIVASFQSIDEVYKLPYSLKIAKPSWDSYVYALKSLNLLTYLKNSLIQVVVCVPCQIFSALLAAYSFSYFEFPLKKILFSFVIASMMIPGETITITLFKMIVKWGLVDTYAGLTITGLISVGAVFMFRQAMLATPKSLYEAAVVDGCGKMRYFFTILTPLCKPLIISQTMLAVISRYNEYLWPMLVTTKDNMRTIQTGIVFLMGASNPGYTMAAVIIVLLIPLFIFIFGLDQIMEGVTAGAVKN